MDETFHGSNPTDGTEPSTEVVRVDTLMHSAHAAHGDFQLHYSDTVLNAGNGRVWADWAVTGIRHGTLVALPYIAWFSQRHRLVLKFGWWELAVCAGESPLQPYRVKSWYEAAAIPVSEFYGGWRGASVRSWCAAMPGEARLLHHLSVRGASKLTDASVILRGATTLGEEAGSPVDAVNATVGDCEPLPVKLEVETTERSLLIANNAASVFGQLLCSQPMWCEVTHGQVTVAGRERSTVKDQLHFEIRCPLQTTRNVAPCGRGLARSLRQSQVIPSLPKDTRAKGRPGLRSGLEDSCEDIAEVTFELRLAEKSPRSAKVRRLSLSKMRDAWQDEWSCLEPLATPDSQLTTALKRAAVYAESLLPKIDAAEEVAGMSDHVEWPVDCARDSFHIASALLFLKPELVRRHLAFYFLDAIPQAGAGKSYVGTGESRGHREARLLDLAAYPLWHLWRYWKATGDDDFIALPQVRSTAEQIVSEVLGWRDKRTGLFTSTERSSDERCVFPIFVPGNAMFVGALERIAETCRTVWNDASRAEQYNDLADELRRSLFQHAVVEDPEFGEVFAFEVGGHGEVLLYDQADMPNLLSLPRFGFCLPDDPVYRNTMRFAYSERNQGFRGTADGKYRQLCDGSKTMPSSPWPLGALGQLLSGAVTPAQPARLFDWLRDALTPAFQLPEICDKHTARPVQRYWFGWPTATLLMAFIEVVCGVKLGDRVRVEPLIPEGWREFTSPRLRIRAHEVLVEAEGGKARVWVDGHEGEPSWP